MGSVTGNNFVVTTFGESHGPALGVVIDGIPAGLPLTSELIQIDLDRRRPGKSPWASPRKETDQAEILSGLALGKTNGAPLCLIIRNVDARSGDYQDIKKAFRPGHADWTYFKKYNLPPQPGGGRSSGRETVSRVAAGAVARALLNSLDITVKAACSAVGTVTAQERSWDFAETNPLRFLDPNLNLKAEEEVSRAMENGDSVGSVVELMAEGVPAGLGEPVFDKLEARLGSALLSIGAVKAVEFGEGVSLSRQRGSEANSPLGAKGFLNNVHGGILGGISTGQPIEVRLFIKPTPSISLPQQTIDITGCEQTMAITGRHDPCLGPRLAPVAEAMCLITLADFCLKAPSTMDGFVKLFK
jgi:chorismate synthase